jgi:hypothetical protein
MKQKGKDFRSWWLRERAGSVATSWWCTGVGSAWGGGMIGLQPPNIIERGAIDTGPIGFLIRTITGSRPWPDPLPDRRGVMTNDANSE